MYRNKEKRSYYAPFFFVIFFEVTWRLLNFGNLVQLNRKRNISIYKVGAT